MVNKTAKGICVFDLDYTLISVNSQYLLTINYLSHAKKNIRYFIYRFLMVVYVRKIFSALFKIDVAREMSFFLLNFESEGSLSSFVSNEFDVLSVVNPSVINLKNEYESKGFKIVLATSSPWYFSRPIAKKLDINVVYSPTDYKNRNTIVGNKYKAVLDGEGVNKIAVFVSDNDEDFDERVQRYYFVRFGVPFELVRSKKDDNAF